jgi:transcriptional regulator with XRE-family HTH domain
MVGICDMSPVSQNVIMPSSVRNHSLCVAPFGRLSHTVSMAIIDKNGGPNHLRAWREYRHLSQEELAGRVGTNQNMIGYLESGERGLSLKWLRRLAPALNTRPGWLADIDPSNADTRTLELIDDIPDEHTEQVVQILSTFAKRG